MFMRGPRAEAVRRRGPLGQASIRLGWALGAVVIPLYLAVSNVALARGISGAAGPAAAAGAPTTPGTLPGTLIEHEPIEGAPLGAAAYTILYSSTGLDGAPIAVSGMAVIPAGAPPPGGRLIVAWAHPTTGVVERCAPSHARIRFQMIAGLRDMVRRGYIVAATDYPGLGTAGPHPYLVGASEARAVIDSVRAARGLPDADASKRFVVWGHSQGGQASLFTGLLAKTYAPELRLVGVAAAAPATELAALLSADLDTFAGNNLTAMTLWSWAKIYNAPIGAVVDPAAMPTVDRLMNECIESIFDIMARRRTGKPLAVSFLSVNNPADQEPWASLLRENTPGALPPDIPVFLAQGLADRIVPPAITEDYARRLCAAGSSVKMDIVPKTAHGFIAARSADAAVAWMADRFAGLPPPSDCVQIAAGAPVPSPLLPRRRPGR
jgi:acetyl esterase/lipase